MIARDTRCGSLSRLSLRQWLLFGMLVVGALALQGGRATIAYFTSSASSTANTFTTGSIHLRLEDSNEGPAGAVSASLTANVATNSWRPGQMVTAPITVSNTGSLGLTYGLAYTAADSGTQPGGGAATPTQFLTLAIKAEGTGTGTAGDCTTANFGNAALWQESVHPATALVAGATQTVFADTTRALVATTGSEVLCLQVAFTDGGAGAENAAMNGTSTVTFTFSAR